MISRHNLPLPGLATALALFASVAAAQTAHVHGEGRVNIAIDGDRVFMALEAPGADIVGFEYAPRSADEKAAVDAALARLGEPLQLLRFDPGADCGVERAGATFETGEDDHAHEEHGHDNDHDKHEDEDAHAAFHAEYEFRCADIDALGRIEFTYFAHFGNAQTLDIVLIDGRGQRSAEASRANPVMRLDP